MLEVLEFIGSICFAVCGVPPAIQAVRTRKVGMDWGFLSLWLCGEVCLGVWACMSGYYILLLLNYVPNITCISIVLWVKVHYRT